MRVKLLTFFAFLCLLIQFIDFFADTKASSQNVLSVSGLLLIAEYVALLAACRITFGDFINIGTLFFLIVGITNVFPAGIFAVGLMPNVDFEILQLVTETPIQSFIAANVVVGVAIFAVFLGMLAALGRKNLYSYRGRFMNVSSTRLAGLIILTVSLPSFLLTFQYEIKLFLSGGYSALFNKNSADLSTWFLQLGSFLPICGYFIFCGTKPKDRFIKILGLSIIGLSAFSALALGGRTGFIVPILVYFWMRKKQGTGISEQAIFLFALFFILATPFIVLWRSGFTGGTAFSVAQIPSNILEGLNNLGTVYYFIPVTIEQFPDRQGFMHFASIWSALAFLVPNIGGLNSNHAGVNNDILNWLGYNYFANPERAAVATETGYSFIAEAYQAFGLPGIFPIMLIVGYAIGKLTIWSEATKAAYKIAFSASLIGPLLFYARDSLTHLFRPMLWFAVPVLLLAVFLETYRVPPKTNSTDNLNYIKQ